MTEPPPEGPAPQELERLVLELAAVGPLTFVFGLGWLTAHLGGVTTPTFQGSGHDRRWRVEVGDEGRWVMSVKLREITSVGFVRGPNPFPKFAGQESLSAHFVGPDGTSTLHCYVANLYREGHMDPEKLEAWTALQARWSTIPNWLPGS